jgi:hypothetical protein
MSTIQVPAFPLHLRKETKENKNPATRIQKTVESAGLDPHALHQLQLVLTAMEWTKEAGSHNVVAIKKTQSTPAKKKKKGGSKWA